MAPKGNICDEQCPLRVMHGLEARETIVHQGDPLKMVGGLISGSLKGAIKAWGGAATCPARHKSPQEWQPTTSCIEAAQTIADRSPTLTRHAIAPVKSRLLAKIRLHGDSPSQEGHA